MGLLSHTAARHVASGNFIWWLPHYAPTYWIVHSSAWPYEIPALSTPWFSHAYKVAYAAHGLIIYRRTVSPSLLRLLARHEHGTMPYSAASLWSRLPRPFLTALSAHDMAAIEHVLGVYSARSDLHGAFGPPSRLNLTELMRWAGGPGVSIDNAAPLLTPYRRGIDSVVGLLTNRPPLVVSLIRKGSHIPAGGVASKRMSRHS